MLQGAKMTQEILWDLNVPFKHREEVVALVKYGSLPLWFWDKSNPQQAVIKASQIIRCDMLAMLAEADVKGRYCNDKMGRNFNSQPYYSQGARRSHYIFNS